MKNVEIERRWNIDHFPDGVQPFDEIIQKRSTSISGSSSMRRCPQWYRMRRSSSG